MSDFVSFSISNFIFSVMVTEAGELVELVESGLHKEYPEVFLECALHNLRTLCIPDFETLRSLYTPESKSLNLFQHAISLLSKHRSAFMKMLQWLHCVQSNTQALQALMSEHFEVSPFSDLKISVIGGLFTPDVYKVIEPYLYSYLLLELISAEREVPVEYNCFKESKTTAELLKDGSTSSLLKVCHELFSPNASFSLLFLLENLVVSFAESAFIYKTKELIGGCYTKSFLESLKLYEEKVMRETWLPRVLDHPGSSSVPWNTHLVYSTYYEVRRPELFSILIDYPESHPSVMDLKTYLMGTRCLQNLIDPLSKEISLKLLQPGVHTDEVLLVYGSLVRSLREIDPSSVAQDIICSPVASYLREREDAVRCIVDRLIAPASDEEGGGVESDQLLGLQKELLLPAPLEVEPADETRDCDAHLVFHDPDECFPQDVWAVEGDPEEAVPEELCQVNGDWDRWMPDPLEALHHTGPPWKRRIDLLSLLVGGIYGSKRSFLTEYRALLSQRLLKQLNFDIVAGKKHLQLLKMRFGEVDMQECEIMLQDIRESKRISYQIADELKSEIASGDPDLGDSSEYFQMQAYILSGEYWPEFHNERFKLPDGLTPTFTRFTKRFEKLKLNRTINWMFKLGMVNVSLDIGGETVTVDVSPVQAAILHLFTLKPRWTVNDIGQQIEVTISAVRRCLVPFIQRGFIEQVVGDGDTYRVCTSASSGATHSNVNVSFVDADGPEEMEISPTKDVDNNSGPQIFWSYILGMLTNLGGMCIDRIHSTLKMFALGSNDVSECTRQQLRQFLEKKINVCVSTLEAELDFAVKSTTNGKRLLENVARTIGLREVWYFGLLYRTNDGEESWLNLDKKAFCFRPLTFYIQISSIDIKKTSPLAFEFRAKFFPEDASKELIQEITQRLFFLQVKEAILKDKLPCPPETAVLLASYACQAKYGDYDRERFTRHPIPIDRLLSPNTLVNHDLQSQDWIRMVVRWYEEHRGMYPQTAMLHYLEIAEGLETYGVEFFEIYNRRGTDLLLGIDAMGLAIYKPPDRITPKVGFPWSEIRNIAFNDRKFTIKPIDKKSSDLVFMTKNLRVNKKILALCIGNNELYVRRRQPVPIEIQQMRSQACEENAFREAERKRLAKEREARIRAERRVRELEARLKEAERRLQWASSSSSSSQDRLKKSSNTPPVASPTESPRQFKPVCSLPSTTELKTENIDETPCPSTFEEDIPSRPSSSSRPQNISLNTSSSTPITPTSTPTPTTTSPRGRMSLPSSSPSVVGFERSSSQLPRHKLELSDSVEDAVQLLESTWRHIQGPPDGAPGEIKEGDEEGELDSRIPSPENRVEFPPAVVENLRSEELRQSAISRDPELREKLRNLQMELLPKNQHQQTLPSLKNSQDHSTHRRSKSYVYPVYVTAGERPDSEDGVDHSGDKFDTIRRIRRGNTKRRVDTFEAL
nr:radixin [Hymenolepis microstoma]